MDVYKATCPDAVVNTMTDDGICSLVTLYNNTIQECLCTVTMLKVIPICIAACSHVYPNVRHLFVDGMLTGSYINYS